VSAGDSQNACVMSLALVVCAAELAHSPAHGGIVRARRTGTRRAPGKRHSHEWRSAPRDAEASDEGGSQTAEPPTRSREDKPYGETPEPRLNG
jgi:hypothetical protein